MSRPPVLRLHADELVVDNFAGGGGASLGIEWAIGRSPDIAVNHDPEAIALHAANHPGTRHFCEDVFKVNPREVCRGRRVALAWFSPDCTYHSNARGGKPFRNPEEARGRRGLAGVVIKWAAQVKPRVILLENVSEFEEWGPLKDGRPDPDRRGQSFRNWLGKLKAQGYQVEMRLLRGCDYGAPTIRRRLFLIARCDGRPIIWPDPTHGPGTARPHRSAAECIDWSIPAPSIFERKKPLAEATLRRIARGIQRYVIEAAEPFLIPTTHHGDDRVWSIDEPVRTITGAKRGEFAIVAPTLVQTGYGERPGQAPRVPGLHKPLGTVMATGQKHALVCAFMAKNYGDPDRRTGGGAVIGSELPRPLATITTRDHHALVATHMVHLKGGGVRGGRDLRAPSPTVCAGGTHLAEVRAFLVKYYRTGVPASLELPFDTVTCKPRYGMVWVHGQPYEICDIGFRMLEPHELFAAQGFEGYQIDVEVDGKRLTREAQIRMCGNSVNPQVAAALVRANVVADEAVAA